MDGGGEEGRGGVNITTISRKRDAKGTGHRKAKGRRRRTIVVGETEQCIVNGVRKDRAQALR